MLGQISRQLSYFRTPSFCFHLPMAWKSELQMSHSLLHKRKMSMMILANLWTQLQSQGQRIRNITLIMKHLLRHMCKMRMLWLAHICMYHTIHLAVAMSFLQKIHPL